jgi:hypothetical protein
MAIIKPRTYLLILIISAPGRFLKTKLFLSDLGNVIERQTARETWLDIGSFDSTEMIHLFVIGTKDLTANEQKRLDVEAEEHSDMLFIDKLVDSFDNLAKKTAFAIESAVRNYEFEYLLKTDTDSFVRVGYLLKVFLLTFQLFFNLGFARR